MDCRNCQPVLVDLLYGELARDAAEQARRHMSDCDECRGAFDKLEAGLRVAAQLPRATAPESATAAIMAMAERHAQAARVAHEKAPAPARPAPLQRLLDFIGHFASTRQVAMATITVLVVALGLLWVPELSRSPELAGNTVLHPDPDAVATAPGVQPAEPLDLQVDRRRGRIRSKNEEFAQAPVRSAPEDLSMRDELAKAEPSVEAPAEGEDPLKDLDQPLFAEEKEEVASAAQLERKARSRNDIAPPSAAGPAEDDQLLNPYRIGGAKGGRAEAFPASPAPSRPTTRAAPSPKKRKMKADDDWGTAAPAPAAEAAADAERKASPAADGNSARALYDQALAAHGRGDYATAMRLLQELTTRTDAGPLRGSADLLSARVLRRWRGCSAALPTYRKLAVGTGNIAGSALLELADCYEQLGDRAQARAALERAAGIDSSRQPAKTRLESMDGDEAAAPAASEATTDSF